MSSNPGNAAEKLSTGSISTPLGVQVWISFWRHILLLLIALRGGEGAQSVLQCSAASRTHTPLGPDSEVHQEPAAPFHILWKFQEAAFGFLVIAVTPKCLGKIKPCRFGIVAGRQNYWIQVKLLAGFAKIKYCLVPVKNTYSFLLCGVIILSSLMTTDG